MNLIQVLSKDGARPMSQGRWMWIACKKMLQTLNGRNSSTDSSSLLSAVTCLFDPESKNGSGYQHVAQWSSWALCCCAFVLSLLFSHPSGWTEGENTFEKCYMSLVMSLYSISEVLHSSAKNHLFFTARRQRNKFKKKNPKQLTELFIGSDINPA